MFFKLFNELLSNPEYFFILIFLLLIIIILLLKVDNLEKNFHVIEDKVKTFEEKLQEYEIEKEKKIQHESDIIDKFLKNNDINLVGKQAKGRINPDEVLHGDIVSTMMNPREDN